MCGLFGFIGDSPDRDMLTFIATESERRGPQAWGFMYEQDGEQIVKKGIGLLSRSLDELPYQSSLIIGLCRLATSGTWQDPDNNQPLASNQIGIVHNGNVYNYRDIYAELGYAPGTQCDSEAILAMLDDVVSTETVERAMSRVSSRSPLGCLVMANDQIFAVRRGHPLYVFDRPEGTYFCSRSGQGGELIEESRAFSFSKKDGLNQIKKLN